MFNLILLNSLLVMARYAFYYVSYVPGKAFFGMVNTAAPCIQSSCIASNAVPVSQMPQATSFTGARSAAQAVLTLHQIATWFKLIKVFRCFGRCRWKGSMSSIILYWWYRSLIRINVMVTLFNIAGLKKPSNGVLCTWLTCIQGYSVEERRFWRCLHNNTI